MPFQRKSRRYYPTRLAINLSSGVSGAGGTVHQPGFIVVETNYRLYAYTGEAGWRWRGRRRRDSSYGHVYGLGALWYFV